MDTKLNLYLHSKATTNVNWMRIGAHHSVGLVTGVMMFCSCSKSSSALSLSRSANGMVQGVRTLKGLASSVKAMWKYSLSIDLMLPSKTKGNLDFNSVRMSLAGSTPVAATWGSSCGWMGLGY